MHKNLVKIWLFFFLYAALFSVFIQLIFFVYIKPSWSAGDGLLASQLDSVSFHRMAAQMAQDIHAHGWSAWHLKPDGQAPVGIVAAIYALTFPKPWVLIPLNACIHAISALFLLQIIRSFGLSVKKSFICALPFLVYPSASAWYAQIHKDGYFILGLFSIIYSLIVFWNGGSSPKRKELAGSFFLFVLGASSIWYVRPYLLKYMGLLEYLIILAIYYHFFISSVGARKLKKILSDSLKCASFVFMVFFFSKIGNLDITVHTATVAALPAQESSAAVGSGPAVSVRSSRFPVLQRAAEDIASLRDGYIRTNELAHAGSGIDNDVRFNDFHDIAMYLPRSLQIDLLAPFPRDWFGQSPLESNTFMRRVAGLEMAGVYFALFFAVYSVWRWRRRMELWIILSLCMSILILQGLVINNIGTLYRLRYGMLMILVALGIAGFIKLLEKRCAGSPDS